METPTWAVTCLLVPDCHSLSTGYKICHHLRTCLHQHPPKTSALTGLKNPAHVSWPRLGWVQRLQFFVFWFFFPELRCFHLGFLRFFHIYTARSCPIKLICRVYHSVVQQGEKKLLYQWTQYILWISSFAAILISKARRQETRQKTEKRWKTVEDLNSDLPFYPLE